MPLDKFVLVILAVSSFDLFLECVVVNAQEIKPREFLLPLRMELGQHLESRLNADQGSDGSLMDCWNALFELKSCTNEIVVFFLNGETSLGQDCCRSISFISQQCWPAMLTSIGFTAEEGDVLRGYCDAKPGPSPLSSIACVLSSPHK